MKRKIHHLLLLTVGILLAACSHTATPEPERPAPTTLLVYMIADNTLGTIWHSDTADLDEMLAAARSGALRDGSRLLVYYNRPGTASGLPPQLLEITRSGIQVRKTYPDDTSVSSLDTLRMAQVFDDMRAEAPAQGYGLVLWSHADGWKTSSRSLSSPQRRSFGDDRGTSINIPALARVLQPQHFRYLYFDCCLMGNIETIYELRDAAPLIVASPTELGIDGMPYHQNLRLLLRSTPDLVSAARNTFNYYLNAPDPADRTCQIALYRTAALPRLAEISRQLYSRLNTLPALSTPLQPLTRTYPRLWSYDMDDIMNLIALSTSSPDLLAQWREALAELIPYSATTTYAIGLSTPINRYCGIGAYLPTSPTALAWGGYMQTAWWRDVVSAAPLYATYQ